MTSVLPRIDNSGVMTASGRLRLDRSPVANQGWFDLDSSSFVASPVTNSGVLSVADSRFVRSPLTNSGWANVRDSDLYRSTIGNTGVLSADAARLNGASLTNSGWINLSGATFDDGPRTSTRRAVVYQLPGTPVQQYANSPVQQSIGNVVQTSAAPMKRIGAVVRGAARGGVDGGATSIGGQLRNTGVLSANNANISARTALSNGGWLNITGARLGASQITNTGVLSAVNQTLDGPKLTNGGWLNLDGDVFGPASKVSNTGVFSVKQAAAPAATASSKPLPPYPSNVIDASGITTIEGYDLSNVTEIRNGGWLNIKGTLRPDVKITNTGVMSLSGQQNMSHATVSNSGWLGIN